MHKDISDLSKNRLSCISCTDSSNLKVIEKDTGGTRNFNQKIISDTDVDDYMSSKPDTL